MRRRLGPDGDFAVAADDDAPTSKRFRFPSGEGSPPLAGVADAEAVAAAMRVRARQNTELAVKKLFAARKAAKRAATAKAAKAKPVRRAVARRV